MRLSQEYLEIKDYLKNDTLFNMVETSDNRGKITLHNSEESKIEKKTKSPSKYEKPIFMGFYIIINGEAELVNLTSK